MFLLAVNVGVDVAAAAPPIVETTGAPVRTLTTAQLGGRVDPRGAATTYFFEYGDQGPCASNPCSTTTAESAGAGDTTVLVSAEASGLSPGSTYHYRLVASNGDPAGSSFGADMTVTTRASEAPLSHGHFPGPPGSDRAWEQVSPADSGGNPVNEGLGFSADGNRALFSIVGGTPLSDAGDFFSTYFSERTPAGWKQRTILPPRASRSGLSHWLLVPDVSLSKIAAANLDEASGRDEIWRLEPGGTAANLFANPEPTFLLGDFGIADNGSRILMVLRGSIDPSHPASNRDNVYDLTSGSPRLVSLMPDGSVPACGVYSRGEAELGWRVRHSISADGSHVFFGSTGSSCEAAEKVYVRDLEAGLTKEVSPSPVSGPECDSVFLSSTPDAALFWTKSRIVAGDTAPNDCADALDGDIYRYDLDSGAVKCATCVIPGLDSDVYLRFEGDWRPGWNLLVSEDASRVYFQSPTTLVPGAPTQPGSRGTYRININTGDLDLVGGADIQVNALKAALTPDGAVVVFLSNASSLNPLNGTDNAGTNQLYRYDDRDRSLLCISCPLDGSAPRTVAGIGAAVFGRSIVSDDGKDIAFSTPTPLVHADQNTADPAQNPEGGSDVYEWRDGKLLLVSDGLTNTTRGAEGPSVSAISPDGRDVFFIAQAQYTPDALDSYRRLYDARIGGGIDFPQPPPPCPLETCQGTPKGVPEEAAPGTASFVGPVKVRNHRPRHGKRGRARHHRAGKKRQPHTRHTRNFAR